MAYAQLARAETGFSATPSTPNTSSTLQHQEFEAVMRDLEKKVIQLAGEDPSKLDKNLSIEGVLAVLEKAAAEKAAKKAADKYAWLKTVTQSTLQCIQVVGGMIADGASEAFPPTQMCFNVLTFVIQAWQGYEGMFENLAELLEKCSEFLERLTIYREKMDIRLACLACQNLRLFVEVCSRTIQLRKKHARLFAFTRQLFLNDNGIQDLLDMMSKLNNKEDLLVGAQTWRIVQDSAGRLDILLEGQRKQRRDQEMKEWRRIIASRLGFPDSSLGSNKEPDPYWRKAYDNRKNSLVDGTGKWILNHEPYTDWVSSDDPRHYMLVAQGESGSGKTSLMANVLRSFRTADRIGPTSRVVSAYYFPEADRRKEDEEDSPGSLLQVVTRTLLWQIATSYEAMTKAFIQILERKPDFHDCIDQWIQLFTNNRERLNSDTTFYLFIDGVDQVEDIPTLMPLLESLSSVQDNKRVRILLNARTKTVDDWLRRSTKLNFEPIIIRELNQDDIKKYIEDRMNKMPITRDAERRPNIMEWRERILKKLQRECQGDFFKLTSSLDKLSTVDLVDDIRDILEQSGQTRQDLIHDELRRLNNSRTRKEIEEINEIIRWVEDGRVWFSIDTLEALLSVKYRRRAHRASNSSPTSSTPSRRIMSPKAQMQSPKISGLGFGNGLGIEVTPTETESRSSSPSGSSKSGMEISLLPFSQKLTEKYALFKVTDSGWVDWRSTDYRKLIPMINDAQRDLTPSMDFSRVGSNSEILQAEINIVRHFLTSVCPDELYKRFDFDRFLNEKAGVARKEGIHIDRHNAHLQIVITCLLILTDDVLKENMELRKYAGWWLLDHMRDTDLSMANRDLKAQAGPLLVELFTKHCGIDALFWPVDLNVSMETWKDEEGAYQKDVRSEWLYTLYTYGMDYVGKWFKDGHIIGAITGTTGEKFVQDIRGAEPKDLHKIVLAPAARHIAEHLFCHAGFTKRQLLAGHWFIRGYLARCDEEKSKHMVDNRHVYIQPGHDLYSEFESEVFTLDELQEIEKWCAQELNVSSFNATQKSLWEIHGALNIFQLTKLTDSARKVYQDRAREALRLNSQNWNACHFIASQPETSNDEAISLLTRAKKEMEAKSNQNSQWLSNHANSALLARTTLELGDRLWDIGDDTAAAARVHRESLDYDYTHFRDYVAILENYKQREAWSEIIAFVDVISNRKESWEAWYDELINEFMVVLVKSGYSLLAKAADEANGWDIVNNFFEISHEVGSKRDAKHYMFVVQDAYAKVLEDGNSVENEGKILQIRRDAIKMARQHPNDNYNKEDVNAMTDAVALAYLERAFKPNAQLDDIETCGKMLEELSPETDHTYDMWSIILPVCCLARFHIKRDTWSKLPAYWLHRVVRASLELLSDEDEENDDMAYWTLTRILTTVGDRENTKIIYNLRNHLQQQSLRAYEQWKLEAFPGSEFPSQAQSEPMWFSPISSRENSFHDEESFVNNNPMYRHATDPFDPAAGGRDRPSTSSGARSKQYPTRTNSSASSSTQMRGPSRRTSAPVRGLLHVNTDSSMPRLPETPETATEVSYRGPTKPDWFVDCAGCGKKWVVNDKEVLHTCADCVGVTKLCEECFAKLKDNKLPKTKTMRCDPEHELFEVPKWIPSVYIGMPKGSVPLPDITGAAGEDRWISMEEWKGRLRQKYLGGEKKGTVVASPTSPTMKR